MIAKAHDEFYSIKELFFDIHGLELSSLFIEEESSDYGACEFMLDNLKVKFRVGKITPTKTGQFVTLWKRNIDGPIEPFNFSDPIDLFIIATRMKKRFGLFIFPHSILCSKGVLTGGDKEGKRAIRVYPPWDKTSSKQASITQAWQSEFFLEISKDHSLDPERFKALYKL